MAAGAMSKFFNTLRITVSAIFIQALSFATLFLCNNISLITLALFFLGLATFVFYTANDLFLLHLCGENSERRYIALNLSRIALNVGFGLSGILYFLLNQHFHEMFLIFSLTLVFISLFLLNLEKSLKQTLANTSKCPETSTNEKNFTLLTFGLFFVFLNGLLIAQLNTTYPLYINALFGHFSATAISILFSLDTLLIICFQGLLTEKTKHVNKLLVLGLGSFLMGAGFCLLAFPFAAMFYVALISCIIWTTGEMLFVPSAQLICYEAGANKGLNLGSYQTIYALTKVIGPTVGTFIYQQYQPQTLWLLCGLVGSLCFIATIGCCRQIYPALRVPINELES